ncbi:hypothetical protein CKA32_007099 [Geitlerinema sp. FC II]|nr:hypothetical protein CKA32_007099 [Geitlerinema sp. FC II]
MVDVFLANPVHVRESKVQEMQRQPQSLAVPSFGSVPSLN